jgi:hypothetical protein
MTTKTHKVPARVVIYTRDVQNITGVKERTARYVLQRVRLAFGKTQGEFVTIAEFCAVTGIEEETVRSYIT